MHLKRVYRGGRKDNFVVALHSAALLLILQTKHTLIKLNKLGLKTLYYCDDLKKMVRFQLGGQKFSHLLILTSRSKGEKHESELHIRIHERNVFMRLTLLLLVN